MKTHFKDWAIPGVVPDSSDLAPGPGQTLDGLCGHFKIFQLSDGHRFSTDDLLTAWYAMQTATATDRILELGSGIGTIGLCVAWRFPGSRITTIEVQEESVALAKKSARFNGVEGRLDQRLGDFRDLNASAVFDLVIGSPPYFPLDAGIPSEHPQKLACRFEMRGSIQDYCQVAARHLAPSGVFTCIFPVAPEHQEERVIQGASDSGLVMIKSRKIVLKEGDPVMLGLFSMMKRDHLPRHMHGRGWAEPPLMIRDRNGNISPEYLAVKLSLGFPPSSR